MDQLRKYIQEAIKVIDEDYESVNQIKTLASDALIFAGTANVDYVLRQLKEGGKVFLYSIKLLDVYQEKSKKYPNLQDFIINSNVIIQFIETKNKNKLGSYTLVNDQEYDKTRSRYIYLYYDGSELAIELDNKLKNYKKLDGKDIYFTFWYKFASTLEHELQHAYDDYRSSSNIFRTKQSQKYDNKYKLPSGREVEFDDPIKQGNKYKEYLNLQHEIWARFTQAISKIHFSTIEFAKTEDGSDYLLHKMKPLGETLKDFTYEFSGWRTLTEKMKKKLMGKVSQFWHKEQELLPEKNKKEIESLKVRKQQMSLAEIKNIIKSEVKKIWI